MARAAFVPGDRWLVVVTGNTVNVWETGDWREQRRMEHDRKIEGVRVSPDGRLLATTQAGGVPLTRVFDLASGVAGGDMASASSWPALELQEPKTTVLIEGNEFMPRLYEHAQVSADGVWNVRFSGLEAKLSDVATGRVIGQFDHGDFIKAARFVPDAVPRWLVTAGDDGTLAVWPLRADDLVREACARLRAIFDPQALAKLITDAHAEGSCEGN